MKKRASGVLMHPSSLPGNYSVGSFGRYAYKFIDFLSQSGFSYWQVLPFCMPDEYGSPYKSRGLFSVNPWFVDLEILAENGLLGKSELASAVQREPYLSEYDRSRERLSLLRLAAERVTKRDIIEEWIDSRGELSYTAEYLAAADGGDSLFFHKFLIYEFHRQWCSLRAYANERGVGIIGDMPMYTSYESADVWAHPELFLLDGDGEPACVAGVPPDCFSGDGQLWGNPLYDWRCMKARGYGFFRERLRHALELFRYYRHGTSARCVGVYSFGTSYA